MGHEAWSMGLRQLTVVIYTEIHLSNSIKLVACTVSVDRPRVLWCEAGFVNARDY